MAAGSNDALWQEVRDAFAANDFGSFAKLMTQRGAPDLTEEYPQSGEAFRGRDRIVELNQAYPAATGTEPSFTLREFRSHGDLAIIEGAIDYGNGTPVSYVGVVEATDGSVTRVTEYFADPFPAPEWRKRFAGA
jgi:ketosteroid isomerase-like protein